MKRSGVIVNLFALLLINVQCDRMEDPLIPQEYYIQVDKPSISFSPEGGAETVTALNRSEWAIHYGIEYHLDGQAWKEGECTYATSSQYGTNDVLEGAWFHATVPRNGYSNELLVAVDQNNTGQSRQVRVFMWSGILETTITINQQ